MSENREMWKEIEFKLFEIGNIDLLIDNYKLTLFSFREKTKIYIAVYVEGKFKLDWIEKDCEIRKRFMCPSKHCIVSQHELNKIRGKKKRQEIKEHYTYIYYSPYWSSFSRLKNHLFKNNKEILIYKGID
mgnify:FL=1